MEELEAGDSSLQKLRELFNVPDEEAAIRVICRRLLNSLHLHRAPIPLRPICRRLKLQVQYTHINNPEDSILRLAPHGFTMELSRRRNWRRNRFTIAHEISHLLLYNLAGTPLQSHDPRQYERLERLCDIGASELLISEDHLLEALRIHGLGREGLKRLYDEFLVSFDALLVKLAECLGANIILWKRHARHGQDPLEYRVYNHFPKYRHANKATWLPTGCTAKHILPNIFEENLPTDSVSIPDFTVLMNKRTTNCHAIVFPFPSARTSPQALPIFEELVVADEAAYDNCIVMVLFSERSRFDEAVAKFLTS